MTHSHDTATPALSVESEYVLVPREPSEAMLRDGVMAWTMPWADVIPQDIDEDRFILAAVYRAMLAAAPAPNPSPAAKGGEALLDECWRDLVEKDDRMSPEEYADMALITKKELAGYLALATPSPQPADAVREALVEARRMIESVTGGIIPVHHKQTMLAKIDAALASDPAPAGEAVEPVGGLRWAAKSIVDTFEQDEAQGYRSKDRLFVLSLLRPALAGEFHPAPEDTARLREDLEQAVRQIEANIAAIERSKEFVQKATALAQTAERERDDTRKALETAHQAMQDIRDVAERSLKGSDEPHTVVLDGERYGGPLANAWVDFLRLTIETLDAARSASREGASDE